MDKFNPVKTKNIDKVNKILSIIYHEKKAVRPLKLKKLKQIAVIDFTVIGDMVMLTPLLRIIRHNCPDAEITLICNPIGKKVLEGRNLVQRFITFPGADFLKTPKEIIKNYTKMRKIAKEISKTKFDLILEPRGDLRYIFFMHFLNGSRKASYSYTGGECFLTDVVEPSEEIEHLVLDKIYFMQQLGFSYNEEDIYPKLILSEEDKKKNLDFIMENNLKGRYLTGIHPGASRLDRQWKGFGELLKLLYNEKKDQVFLVFLGPGEDTAVECVVNSAKECGADVRVVSTGIREYISRIAICNRVICNDSGAGHIAAAFSVPVTVIFGPALPKSVRPYGKNGVTCISKEIECKPCGQPVCKYGNAKCLDIVSAQEVFEAMKG